MEDEEKPQRVGGIEEVKVKRLPVVMCPRCNRAMVVERKKTEEEKSAFFGTKKVNYLDYKCPDCGTKWSEKIEEGKKRECFIATAAYGSPMADQVESFRKFRDYRLTGHVGKLFTNFYYAVSPPIAKMITRSEKLRRVTRSLLQSLLNLVRSMGY